MRLKVLALVSGLALALAAPAWAGSVTFNFATLAPAPGTAAAANSDLGSSVVQFLGNDGASVLTAESFSCTGSCAGASLTSSPNGPDLFYKVAGVGETGLGLTGTANNEVSANFGIGLFPSVPAPFDELTILGSVQTGESFEVFGCMFGGGTCTSLASGTGGNVVDVSIANASNFNFLFVTTTAGNTGNVLIDSVTVSSVPEPASLALFGTALLLLAGFGLRRYRRTMGKMSA